ncbi:hypothetical protein DID88_002486 [Monilinia fructigena]|uniref:Uncharacterized protein n=1 Tax=Monilinia fructigena TaxID=38457 RepID=A0A395INY3_9HELO|nr:hypothetical protein DID88_002486 [Monilinia fructigena]
MPFLDLFPKRLQEPPFVHDQNSRRRLRIRFLAQHRHLRSLAHVFVPENHIPSLKMAAKVVKGAELSVMKQGQAVVNVQTEYSDQFSVNFLY